jgi:hypothetical protein
MNANCIYVVVTFKRDRQYMQELHSSVLQVRTPPQLSTALRVAADRDLLSVSAYVRRALVQKLREDGIDPTPSTGLCSESGAR